MKKSLLGSTLLAPLLLTACAGGGGGSAASVTPATIGPFARATAGATPPSTPAGGYQLATSGEPSIKGVLPPNGTAFAATQTVIKIAHDASGNPTSVTADAATMAGGATVSIADRTKSTVELKVPNLGIDAVLRVNDYNYSKQGDGTFLALSTVTDSGGANPLHYAMLGDWTELDASGHHTLEIGEFILGYQTPAAGVPAAGSATYSGKNNVIGVIVSPSTSLGAFGTNVVGDGSLTANFATGAVTGGFSNLSTDGSTAWNTVGLTGTLSGALITGSTAATSAPGTPGALLGSATGTFAGGFYGPVANEVALVWTLSDGTNSVLGLFGAAQNSPPATIGAFEAATPGTPAPSTGAAGYQLATGAAPAFTGTGPTAGTVFALTQSSLKATFTPGGAAATVAADSPTDLAGATLTAQATGPTTAYELKIPNLGVDVVLAPNDVSEHRLPNGTYAYLSTVLTASGANYLDYAVLGAWNLNEATDTNAANTGFFVAGYQTPPANVPTSGSATYSGTGNVYGEVFAPNASGGSTAAVLKGDGSLTANFTTGGISGALSNLTYGSGVAWNTVTISGAINAGASTFNGATSTSFAPGTTLSLAATATGVVRGGFYGPTAQQVAAVWTLSDGTRSAVGVFGAKVAPSDRRLKRDIVAVGSRGGIRLYRYRYLGCDRTFVGVMAQDLAADPRFAHSIIRRPSGLLLVDYGLLGLDLPDSEAMAVAGFAAVEAYEMAVAA